MAKFTHVSLHTLLSLSSKKEKERKRLDDIRVPFKETITHEVWARRVEYYRDVQSAFEIEIKKERKKRRKKEGRGRKLARPTNFKKIKMW